MQVKEKLYCAFNNFSNLPEEIFIHPEIAFRTVSLTDENYELMIFVDRDVYNNCYNIIIYKKESSDTHRPHASDNSFGYDENAEYTTIYFANYNLVKEFLRKLAYNHREYHQRPYRKIKN